MSKLKLSEQRVAMTYRIAREWVASRASPEWRVAVYDFGHGVKNLPQFLKAFRDGKNRIASLPPVPDLGIRLAGDSLTLWSSDREGLVQLDRWLTSKGYETTGVW